MAKKENKKKNKVVNIISNIVFIPVMIVLIVYLVYAFSVAKENGVPTFFGQSYVRVLSGSMKPDFQVGDIAVIKKVKLSELQVGDVIAFYETTTLSEGDSSLIEDDTFAEDFTTGQQTFSGRIKFHKIYDIKYTESGKYYFETYGINNKSSGHVSGYSMDGYTEGKYVVGVYTPSFMASFIQFISSTTGMIILIILPSCVLLFMLLLNIIEIVDQMMRDKKQKQALATGDVKERELEVTTIIDDTDQDEED
jgi:signal peptidase I